MSEQIEVENLSTDNTEIEFEILNSKQIDAQRKKINVQHGVKTGRLYVSFIKTVTWSTLGLFILYLLTGTWEISVTFTGIRTVLYFIHERFWERSRGLFSLESMSRKRVERIS